MKNREIMLYLVQIISIYNAIILGWQVKKIGLNTYELSRQISDNVCDYNYDLNNFVNNIVTIKKKERKHIL